MTVGPHENMLSRARWFIRVIGSAASRFYWDNGFSRAAALAYTTLFALVPVVALSFSVMTKVFRVDEAYLRRMLETILPPLQQAHMVELQTKILDNLLEFIQNVGSLDTVNLLLLVLTGIALLNTIESALNAIWRVASNLSWLAKVTNFWAVITLGPLLVTASMIWTARLMQNVEAHGPIGLSAMRLFDLSISIVVTWLAFSFLFMKLPSTRVRFRHAALGAAVSALLFEVAKAGFAYYLTVSQTYSTLYGVLAALPLFLFWLYVTWVVVLYGAEISYQAGTSMLLRSRGKYATDLGEIGAILGLRVLVQIGQSFRRGKQPPTEGEIVAAIGSDPVLVRTCLEVLTAAGILSTPDPERNARALLIAPEKCTLRQIVHAFFSRRERKHLESTEEVVQVSEERVLETFRRVVESKKGRGEVIDDWTLLDFLLEDRLALESEVIPLPPRNGKSPT